MASFGSTGKGSRDNLRPASGPQTISSPYKLLLLEAPGLLDSLSLTTIALTIMQATNETSPSIFLTRSFLLFSIMP